MRAVIQPTIGPVHGEGGPGELHLLRGVVGVQGGVEEQGHALHHESEAPVEQQPHLVPPWKGSGGIAGRLVDQGQGWQDGRLRVLAWDGE